MTQLALLLALGFIGLVLSFALARLEVRRGPIAPTVKRIEGAVDRACQALLWRSGRRVLVLLLVPAAGLVACCLLFTKAGGPVSPAGRAAFACIALVAGGLSAFVHARLALALGVRACSVATAAAARGSSLTLRPLLRASGALAVFGEGLGLLGVGAAFALLYAVRGGFAQTLGSTELTLDVVRLLPAFALGAAVSALAIAGEGSSLSVAALVGGGQAVEREAELTAQDPRNPAALVELIGDQVGGLLPRALAGYVAGLAATVGASCWSLTLVKDATYPPLTCLLLLLVVRAFGVVGSMCGVFAARADESEAMERALWRGQLSALLVALFGLGAGLYWLRISPFLPLFLAGAAGLAIASVVSRLLFLPLSRGASKARETADARGLSDGAAIALGLGSGISSLLPVLLLPPVGLWLVERLHLESAATPAAQSVLLVTFVAGLVATAPFSLAVAGFGLLSAAAQSVAALARLDGERRSSARLGEVGTIGGGAAGAHGSLVLAVSLLLGLYALAGPALPTAPRGLGWSALLAGIILVLGFGMRAARGALLGARGVADEVKRQLRDLPRQDGALAVPQDFAPSYKACVDCALASVRQGSLLVPLLALLAPFLLAALTLTLHELSPLSALSSFASAAVLSGLIFALACRATRAALHEARSRSRSSAEGRPLAGGSLAGFGDVLGVAAATSVEALIGTVALSILALTALLG